MGPGVGALCVREPLKAFLPVPRVEYDGKQYYMDFNCPESIGKVRMFMGNANVILRVYMWIRQLGADGLREAAVCAVLNNQYMMKKVGQIKGVKIFYAEGKRRIEQCRYSWQPLKEDTGFGTVDVTKRLVDFGMQHYWQSHHRGLCLSHLRWSLRSHFPRMIWMNSRPSSKRYPGNVMRSRRQ